MNTIFKHSTEILTYLVIKSAMELDKYPDTFYKEPMNQILADNLTAWINHIDERWEIDKEAIEVIKNDLHLELQEGSYLNDGGDAFLNKLANYIGEGYQNTMFYELAVQAVKLPNKIQR